MPRPTLPLLFALVVLSGMPPALAQSIRATSGGAAGSAAGSSGPTPSSPAPSAGETVGGKSALGPETATEREADEKMKKDTTICKGC